MSVEELDTERLAQLKADVTAAGYVVKETETREAVGELPEVRLVLRQRFVSDVPENSGGE